MNENICYRKCQVALSENKRLRIQAVNAQLQADKKAGLRDKKGRKIVKPSKPPFDKGTSEEAAASEVNADASAASAPAPRARTSSPSAPGAIAVQLLQLVEKGVPSSLVEAQAVQAQLQELINSKVSGYSSHTVKNFNAALREFIKGFA